MGVLSRGIAIFAALATFAATPLAAHAADMSLMAPPMTGQAPEEGPVTFASGWYLRGDFAVTKDIQIAVGSLIIPQKSKFPNAWSIGLGGGYKFNDWIRADVTLDYRAPRAFSGNTLAMPCTIGLQLSGATSEVAINDTCHDWTQARLTNFHGLFNLYADLGTWYGVTPYVGVGVGANYVYQKVQQNWFMSNGQRYNIYIVDAINPLLTFYMNYDQARAVSSLQLAYAVMGGFSYAMTPNLAVDVGLRYLNLGQVRSISNFTGATTTQKNVASEMRIGFRYTPD